MEYTNQQLLAIDSAVKCTGLYRIGGYAGTGKTTIAKDILRQRPGGIPCTFTGKASSVLVRKGVNNATTIHQVVYRYDEHTNRFYKKNRSELNGVYFLIDEGSMVPKPQWKDICSYNIPRIVIGDPGQLEPVGEDAKLMYDPDMVLDTIHRYDSGVAEFAQYVRVHGEYPPTWLSDSIQIKQKSEYQKPENGVILCGYNKTRVGINKSFAPKTELFVGAKLVVLSNNWEIGVNNGMLLDVLELLEGAGEYQAARCKLDNGRTRELLLWIGNIHKEKTIDHKEKKNIHEKAAIVDFGYALTVHKFQGSEDSEIVVIDEQCDLWEPARWRYTAVTRTSDKLTIYV